MHLIKNWHISRIRKKGVFWLSEMVQYLLSKEVDLTVKTKKGDTLLHAGVHGNKPDIVDALIKAGTVYCYLYFRKWKCAAHWES